MDTRLLMLSVSGTAWCRNEGLEDSIEHILQPKLAAKRSRTRDMVARTKSAFINTTSLYSEHPEAPNRANDILPIGSSAKSCL